MNHHQLLLRLSVICIFMLTSCGAPTPPPTLAWKPPTATVGPRAAPTPTPTRRPDLPPAERQRVEAGGYSFQAPINLEIKISAAQATITNQDDTTLIVLGNTPRKNDTQTVKSALTGFLLEIKDIRGLLPGKSYPAKIDGIEGLAVDITGTLGKTKGKGRVTLVEIGKPGFFFAFAFASDGPDGDRWEKQGSQMYDALINSIQLDQAK